MNKEIVGFTAGNFDLLHPGYIYTFEEAKRHCDRFLRIFAAIVFLSLPSPGGSEALLHCNIGDAPLLIIRGTLRLFRVKE